MVSRVPAARAVLAGFAISIAILAVLVSVVGVDDVAAALAVARRDALAVLLGVAACWIVAWSHALHAVFGVLDVASPRWRTVLVYATLQFANNVAPFSAAGGEPLAALLISRSTRSDFETCLAAVVSTDVLNFLPGPAMATLGLVSVLSSPETGPSADRAATAIAGASLLLLGAGYLGWRNRRRIEHWAAVAIVALGHAANRLVPRLPAPAEAEVADRLDRLVRALERVAASPRTLLGGLVFATVGWLLLSVCLWVSLVAIGESVPLAVTAFVVPVVNVTDLVPLPGGVGTVEPVLVLLLDVAAAVPLAEATAAVLVYRTATYWLPVVVGGGLVVALGSPGGASEE